MIFVFDKNYQNSLHILYIIIIYIILYLNMTIIFNMDMIYFDRCIDIFFKRILKDLMVRTWAQKELPST